MNTYFQEKCADSEQIYVTESIENLPLGWRAKYIIIFEDNDHFTEYYLLAKPGAEFSQLMENNFVRIE